jgi:hypothetical protein
MLVIVYNVKECIVGKKIRREREVLSIPLTNGSSLTTVNVSMKGAQVNLGVIFHCDIRRGYCGRNATSNPARYLVRRHRQYGMERG